MQDFIRETVLSGVDLYYIGTDKFKTGYMTVNLVTPLRQDTASLGAVLPSVLRRGTSTHPDMEQISAALDDLYGAQIEPLVYKRGEAQLIGFEAEFADDKYLPKDADVFEHVCDMTAQLLIYPATYNGRLREEYVKSERDNLIDEIRGIINDKQRYASNKMLEVMYPKEPYSVSRLGDEVRAKNITVYSLTKYYRDTLKSSKLEIFYSGSLDFERVKSGIISSFQSLPREGNYPEIITQSGKYDENAEIKRKNEYLPNVIQGKLAMGIRLGMGYKLVSLAALMVWNAAFGGSVTSKLFTNVRERLSLCYYASSQYDSKKGLVLVGSGIDKDKYEIAEAEILHQLDEMIKGNISEGELSNAKSAVISKLKRVMDSQRQARSYFTDMFTDGPFFTPEEMIELCGKVTVSDLTEIGKTIKCDTVYFVAGREGSENE